MELDMMGGSYAVPLDRKSIDFNNDKNFNVISNICVKTLKFIVNFILTRRMVVF